MFSRGWRYHRFHISYLFGAFSVGLLVGLYAGREVQPELGTVVIIIALALVLGAFRSARWWAILAAVVAGGLVGALRAQAVAEDYDNYQAAVGTSHVVRGVVGDDPEVLDGGRQRIVLSRVEIKNQHYPGKIFVNLYDDAVLKRGDRVELYGSLREGFASYGAALTASQLRSVQRGPDMIRDIRERFAGAVRSVIIEPMASLGLGFVVGQRSALPESLDEQLRIVGLTHIVVASGYNLTILVRFMMRLLSRHSRYLALVSSLAAILFFVLFSGFSPSMNRAVIVTALGLLAWYVGRRFHPLLLIVFVAAVTAIWNPMYVWSDLGWYLSFFAFIGVLIVAPLAMRLLYRRREPSSFEQLIAETMGAEVMALPLIAFTFGSLPVLGLVSNVLVAPFIPAAMALTATTGVLAMIAVPFGALLALPTMILIGYMVAVVEWLAGLSFAEHAIGVGLSILVSWYLGIAGAAVIAARRSGYDFRSRDRRLEL